MGREKVVSVSAAILNKDRAGFPRFLKAPPVMMAIDHSAVPVVVLIVEDEMLLRMRAAEMVEDAGFTSVEAVDADEAIAILEARSDIALLFTDIQMPGSMDGLRLAHSVRERWPPIKIILASGQLKLVDIEIPANSRFFGKPIEAKEMIAEMRSMIGLP
jgi:CheY-like chemotaxis protein